MRYKTVHQQYKDWLKCEEARSKWQDIKEKHDKFQAFENMDEATK